MLNKRLLLLLIISTPLTAMRIDECTIQMHIDGTEVLKRKVAIILKESDSTTQSIIKDLLTQKSTQKSSPEQKKQKAVLLQKISDSDD